MISPDGYAVTNNHVVDGADKVEVTIDDGKIYKAGVIGTDKCADLVLIKVERGSEVPFVKRSDAKPHIGDWVLRSAIRSALAAPSRPRRLGQRSRHRQ